MRRKSKKTNNLNINQTSFHFEDYIETNKKNKLRQNKNLFQDRIYLLFFLFFSLILIFSIKIIHISLNSIELTNRENSTQTFSLLRRDIVDRNGEIISRNVKSFHVAINPKLLTNKENLIIKLRLNFPELKIDTLERQLNKGKYFYLKKRVSQDDKEKFWSLGEKAIIFEPFQSRIYTHANLFSHIIGQVDFDNFGISGIEKFFDRELRDKKFANEPLKLTLDTNIQYLVDKELNKALTTFEAKGGGALLMDIENGDILSLVSLPNFNINERSVIRDKNYINKITKGVYELGSIFKTFTIAIALENNLVTPTTIIKDIPRSIKCSNFEISDIKEFPKNLSVEDILIRSSNVGTLMVARKIGEQNYKKFLNDTNLLERPKLELEELGKPINFDWNKCKLETVSYGHGITTTPLQATSIYASLTNGGKIVEPKLIKKKSPIEKKRLVSETTSKNINKILRKVVSETHGTAKLADIHGYYVGGKTGTSQNYDNENQNLNTFISVFPSNKPKYALLVMLENPQIAKNLIYNYKGMKIKGFRNEAGWNSVYVAGKIIEKIGPILAIKN